MDGEADPQPQASNPQEETPPPPPVPPQNQGILTEGEGQPSQNGPNIIVNLPPDRTRSVEILQAVINGGLAVIGLAAICIYGGQLKVMQSQLTTAEWASYNACVSNQISRRALLEVQKTNTISQEMAVASAQQAAGEVDTDKSYIVFNARLPTSEELALSPNFGIVYSIKNDGKSAANNVRIGFSAILVRNDEVFKINDRKFTGDWHSLYFPAGDSFPGTPEIGRPITPFIEVRDTNGRYVLKTSADVPKVFSDSAIIAVIGSISYSDFAGTHEDRFCSPVYEMQAGTTRKPGIRPNERTCFNYNHRQDSYGFTAKPPPEPRQEPLPEISCPPPKRN